MFVPVRRPDWRLRLEAFILRNEPYAFSYGDRDCFRLAKGGIKACTGVSVFPEFDGAYTNRFGLLRFLILKGYRGVPHAAHGLLEGLGFALIAEQEATFGDIVMVPGEPQASLGICAPNGLGVIVQAKTKLMLAPSGHGLAAWRIPYGD